MPASRIRADYDSLSTAARAFGQEAAQTRQTLTSLRRHMDTLQSGDWIGQGATAFYREMNDAVLPSLQRLTNALEMAERVTQLVSRLIQTAEHESAAAIVAGLSGAAAAATGAASSGDDEDMFADVYAALGQSSSDDGGDEDLFAGIDPRSAVPTDTGGGGSSGGEASPGAAAPGADQPADNTPAGGGGGDRNRGQGGPGGVGGASLGGGAVGPEANPLAPGTTR